MSDLYPEDLAGMSPREIVEAYRAGRFDAALRGERRPEPSEQSTTDDSERPRQRPRPYSSLERGRL